MRVSQYEVNPYKTHNRVSSSGLVTVYPNKTALGSPPALIIDRHRRSHLERAPAVEDLGEVATEGVSSKIQVEIVSATIRRATYPQKHVTQFLSGSNSPIAGQSKSTDWHRRQK